MATRKRAASNLKQKSSTPKVQTPPAQARKAPAPIPSRKPPKSTPPLRQAPPQAQAAAEKTKPSAAARPPKAKPAAHGKAGAAAPSRHSAMQSGKAQPKPTQRARTGTPAPAGPAHPGTRDHRATPPHAGAMDDIPSAEHDEPETVAEVFPLEALDAAHRAYVALSRGLKVGTFGPG